MQLFKLIYVFMAITIFCNETNVFATIDLNTEFSKTDNDVTKISNDNEVVNRSDSDVQHINVILEKPSQEDLDLIFPLKIITSGTAVISGSQIKIDFDNSKLMINSIIPEPGIWMSKNIDKINQNSYFTLLSLDTKNKPILLNDIQMLYATVIFKIIGEGTTIVSIDNDVSSACDNQMDEVKILSSDCQLSLSPIYPKIDISLELQDKVKLNEDIQLKVKTEAKQDEVISGIQTKIMFDKSKLTITDISKSDYVVFSNTIDCANTNGYVNIAYINLFGDGYSVNKNDVAEIINITFKAIKRGIASIYIDDSSTVSDIYMNNITGSKANKNVKIGVAIAGKVIASIAGYDSLVIPNAAITLKYNDKEFSASSDINGDFEFLDVPPGNYTLIINAPDLETFTTQIDYDAQNFYFIDLPKLKVACLNNDINLDKKIGLEEAIYVLKIMTAGSE